MCGLMPTIVGNGFDNSSSNPGWVFAFHFMLKPRGKLSVPSLLPSAMGKW